MISNKIQKMVAGILIVSIMVFSVPFQTHALFGVADTVVVVGDVSVTGIQNSINHNLERLKNFVLDKLATMIAKQILHKLTMSVINWINTGFKGSPAFLTNPAGFFLDAADQVTGAFLATNGPLSSLCSPFNIDLRLSLALNQSQLANQRYTCTLGKIIESQKNGPSVMINGRSVSTSNGTMNGFIGGDFNQGGWPAFIAMTVDSQNSPYGAVLQAKSDLYAQIGGKQNNIRADLQLGSGFMSWENCKDILIARTPEEIDTADALAENDMTLTRKINKDNSVTYQSCETQTPGSIIAGTLQTNLNVPVVELELANDINAVVNALITQLISTMLTGGLGAMSGTSGNGGYTQSVIDDANSIQNAQAVVSNLQGQISPAIDQVNSYKYSYDSAVSTITNSKNQYQAALDCFTTRQSNYGNTPFYNTDLDMQSITNIRNAMSTQVDPLLTDLKSKQASANADLKELEDMSYSISGTGSAEEIQIQAIKYSLFVERGGLSNMQSKIDTASAALGNAQTQAQTFNNDAARYMTACRTQSTR